MSRMAELNMRRADERRARASAAVSSILEGAAAKGVGITVIGSFARGDFRAHSDIDLLVRGPVDPKRRVLVERLVADGVRGSDIPYDLIFEADLTEDRVQDLLNDVL